MDKPAWELAKRLFHEALEETGPERMRLVEEACGDDRKLLAQVVALIQAHEEAGDFLSEPMADPSLLTSCGFPVEETGEPPSDPPARIGPYEIIGVLGTGGMGTVLRARDLDLHRNLAIKVLPADLATPRQVARFQREARVLASLNHPNIATIHAFGEADGRPYLVLELIEGQSLLQRIENGPLTVEATVDLGCQIARAMEAAHEAGIVHRDLKPANVMITPRGLAKILDFGLARTVGSGGLSSEGMEITASGILVGTIPYLSPEQIADKEVDTRSDLWALGCVLFEALTGRSPFERSTAADTLVAIQGEAPDLAALPRDTPAVLRELISDCLRKDPSERPASAQVVRGILSDVLPALPSPHAGSRSRITLLGRLAWTLFGVLATVAVLGLTERGMVRAFLGVLPDWAKTVMTDGGLLAAVAVPVLGVLFFGFRALAGAGPAVFRQHTRSAVVALVAVLGLVTVYLLGRWMTVNADVWGPGSINVYVSLPFEGSDDEDAETLLSISERYRATLQTVFSDVASVNVLPASYDRELMRAYPPQCTFQRARAWLSEDRIDPDLVLCNNVNVFLDPGGGMGLRVVSSLEKARDERLEFLGRIEALGSDAEVQYLALLTSARIVEALRQEQALRLTSEEEGVVSERILEKYSLFLSLLGEAASEVAQLVDDLRERTAAEPNRRVEDVIEALRVYETSVSLEEDEVRLGRARDALLRRIGGAR